ncbi:hypothetical protein [Spirosoma arboris]|uniref:hypothetical protein n=1 Tax=Spirosoma arboris TaxID=2682092 RepID=UPI0018DB0DA5|nr:hypothetical protein [Spirosoma arboris]
MNSNQQEPQEPSEQEPLEPNEEVFHEGRHLRNYLDFHQIPLKQLAHQMGVTAQAVGSQTRSAIVTPRVLDNILRILGVSHEEYMKPLYLLPPPLPEGHLLKAYMYQRKIPQVWLAQKLNKTKATITDYFQAKTFTKRVREDILAALRTTEEEVFGSGQVLLVTPPKATQEEPSSTPVEDALSMVRRQLAEWQALLSQLQAQNAPAQQLSFCQYQIWHLELSLPALGLSIH